MRRMNSPQSADSTPSTLASAMFGMKVPRVPVVVPVQPARSAARPGAAERLTGVLLLRHVRVGGGERTTWAPRPVTALATAVRSPFQYCTTALFCGSVVPAYSFQPTTVFPSEATVEVKAFTIVV